MSKNKKTRVLALYPFTRGFGYALFEGQKFAIDWGMKEARKNKNARSMKSIKELITFYYPDVIILEDYAGTGSRRCKRVQRLIRDITRFAKLRNVRVYQYSRGYVREIFSSCGATTKYEIAEIITEQFPEFKPRLPSERKLWMSEDPRMSIFDAASLALTFFFTED
jgi:hypothetical protein